MVKMSASNRFPWPPWYLVWCLFCPWAVCLEIKICRAICHCLFYISTHVDPVDGFMYQQPCLSMPIWFTCSWFSAFPWSDGGITIPLPFIKMLLIIAISSLNDQYCCRFLCTSVVIDSLLCNTYSDSMLRCSSLVVADLISLWFMVKFIPSILSLLVSWLCLDSQLTMNSCSLNLYGKLMDVQWYSL